MTTDTPRTDASLTDKEAFCQEGLLKCSKELERELKLQKEITKGWLLSREVIIEERDELQAEVERLKEEVERLRKEIALRDELDAVSQEVWDELKTENAKLREIIERYRVWATSENPTEMELDYLKQKYDELN